MDGLKALIGGVAVRGGVLDVVESQVRGVVVLALTGELDMLTAPQLEQAIATAARKAPPAVIVDLAGVRFLATAGLNVLVAASLGFTGSAQFGIVAEGAVVRRPLVLTGIDTFVTLFPSLDDALANFAEESDDLGDPAPTTESDRGP
jgi:anti-sigma B factor antagonist